MLLFSANNVTFWKGWLYLFIYWLVLGLISGLLSSWISILSLESHLACWLQPHYKEELNVAFLKEGIALTRIHCTGFLCNLSYPAIFETLAHGLFPQSPSSFKLTYFLGEVCDSDLISFRPSHVHHGHTAIRVSGVVTLFWTHNRNFQI
jgi:hypothetical protein